MPSTSIDNGLNALKILWPGVLHAVCAAIPLGATAGSVSSVAGVFRDKPGSKKKVETNEVWDITHSRLATKANCDDASDRFADGEIVEKGAIAVIATVLFARDNLRFSRVVKIGDRSDFTVTNSSGLSAGVIECKGNSTIYSSTGANAARKNVKRSNSPQCRIGVVAFGRPEIRIEVVR